MKLSRVIGDVVSTTKDEKLEGFKLLLVQPVDVWTLQPNGDPIVAVDTVGAGEGEIVIFVAGSSARMTTMTSQRPVDSAIIGIIDYVDVEGKRTFAKV
jgi:microcompartment protein CcmK/EutM